MNTHKPASQTFDNLYAQYELQVRKIIGSVLHSQEDTLDCSQSVWTHLWARLQACEPVRDVPAYLRTAAFTTALQYRRDRAAHQTESLDQIAEKEHSGAEEGGNGLDRVIFGLGVSTEPVLSRSFKNDLKAAVDELPLRTRQIVNAHYWSGLNIAEIAKKFKIAQGTVKWHLSEGRNQIRDNVFGMREVA